MWDYELKTETKIYKLKVDNKGKVDFDEARKIIHNEMKENILLRQRLEHLLQSDFIRSFDAVDFETHKYKRDIAEADKIALRKNLEFHYEHLDQRPILTGEDAKAFTKAFIKYLGGEFNEI